MYRMIYVCLALSISLNATEIKINNQSKTDLSAKIKKAENFENTLTNIQSSVKASQIITNENRKSVGSTEVFKKLEGLSVKYKKSDKVKKSDNTSKAYEKQKLLKNKNSKAVDKTNSLKKDEQSVELIKKETREEQIAYEKFKIHGKTEQKRTVRPQYIQGPRRALPLNSRVPLNRDNHDQIFISEYCDYATSGYTGARFIEVYNPTGQDVILGDDDNTYYYVVRYANGGTNPTSISLSGTLAPGETYVVANNQDKFVEVFGFEADKYNGNISGNGDDTWALSTTNSPSSEVTAAVFDVLGEIGVDGDNEAWNYADQTIERNPGYGASLIWAAEEWSLSVGTSDYATPGSHVFEVEEEGPYFSEDFEGTFPPDGWVLTGDSYASYWGTSYDALWAQDDGSDYGPGFAASGDYCAFFNSYDYYYDLTGDMVTPEIDLTNAVSPKLSFDYWDSGFYPGSDYLNVQVSNSDGSYTSLGANITQTDGWEAQEYDLSSYVGQVIKIRFVVESDYGSTNPHLDNVTVAEPPSTPVASLSTNYMAFGHVFVGGSKTFEFAFANVGGANLSGTSSSTNDKFSVSALPGRIAPNDTVLVAVTYTPTEVADDSGYVILTHDGDSSPDSIMVIGSGSSNVLTEGFDLEWTGSPAAPAGWTNVVISGLGGWEASTSSYYAYEGTSSAKGEAGYGNTVANPGEHLLISPALDLSGGKRLTFMLDGYAGSGADPAEYTHLEVQISSQNTDATTGWTTLESFTQYGDVGTPQPGSYQKQIIFLDDYTGVHYLGFRLTDVYGFSIYIDNVVVESIPAVEILLSTESIDFGPTFISNTPQEVVGVVNNGGADATPTISSTNSKFTAALSAATVAGIGSSVDLTITYTPTEESSDTGYVVLTHSGESSPDSIMVVGVGTYNLITEGFDGIWTGSPAAPAGWQVINSDDDSYTWTRSNLYIQEVNGYAAHGMGSQDDWLVSPTVSLADNYLLKWWDVVESSSYNNTYSVWVFPNGDLTSGDSLGVYNCINTALTQHTLNLSSYNGQSISVGFHQIYSHATNWGFGIDDVTIELAPVVPILSLSTNVIEFIPTELDSSREASIGIANTGSGDLSGTITYTAGLSGPAAFTNTDVSVDVVFTGTQVGPFSGSVYFATNGGNDTVDVSTVVGKSVATWDDDLDGDGESDWPVGWEVTQVADESGNYVGDGWEFYNDGGHTGDGYTYAASGGSGTKNNDWLITPVYQVASGDSISFYAKDDGGFTGYPDIMTVHVSPTASNSISSFTVELDSVTNMGQSWIRYSYDLSAYIDTDIRIAIVYRAEYGEGLNIDDVVGPKAIAPAGPIIYEYPTSLNFASSGSEVSVGDSDILVFDYLNNGGADLEVSAVTFEGPFSLSRETTLPIVTGSGAVGAFDVVFTPLADSVYVGSMTVTHNAGDPITVSLGGVGFDGLFIEDFGAYDADAIVGDGYTPLFGWTWNDNGMSDTVPDYTNMTGSVWQRAALGSNAMLYHTYGPAGVVDADTIISPAIILPEATTGYHYELETREYQAYLDYALAFGGMCGVAVSSDSGATFTMVGETNYDHLSYGTFYNHSYDLTGFSGDTIHIAFIYHGMSAEAHAAYGISQIWGVTTMKIREKEDPSDPVFSHSKLVFPVTVVGETVSRKMFFQNVGAGTFNGSIVYPASMSGPASITGLVPGTIDSMVVTYTPSTAGIETGDITIDGSASVDNNGIVSNIGVLSMGVHANAGELAFDLETRSAGWSDYSLAGQDWISSTGSLIRNTWRWYGGTGHSGPNYYGVYSYAPRWGGVNDYLVSPRYSVGADASEVLSFFTQGGYSDGSDRDSINVWVSTEQPEMGVALDTNGVIVDTGFVNPTTAFNLVYESLPSFDKWDPVNIDLSAYDTDVWVMIQSVQRYKENGSPDGWMLKVDDLGTPDIYENPLAVLRVGTRYDFGVTNPDGDSVKYFIRNTGLMDLVIDSMNFDDGMYFDVEYAGTFPITIVPGGIDSIEVFWMPEMEGRQTDTLRYFSNYVVGEVDAFGFGTDHSVFTADASNAPPGAVMLLAPDPASTPLVEIDASNVTGSTEFFWTSTSDPDGTPIEYIFEIMVPGDTLDTLLSSAEFSLEHALVVEMMEDLSVTSFDATWDVHAYDGFEATGSSNGPWALSFDGGWVLGGLENNAIPDVFALHNNYPNPFNPITNIRYDIPVASDVRIDIYNIAGEKVRTLVSREHQPGRYKIQWNATNEFGSPVATGMYIYKINAKDFVSVKKLLLMK